MINRLLILNNLFLILSSTMHASEPASSSQQAFATPPKKFFNQNPEKQSLIKKIFIYSSFNELLNINNADDDLFLIKQLIQKGQLANLETLTTYFKEENLKNKNPEQTKHDEQFLNNLIHALYCLSWSEEDIAKIKNVGKRIVIKAHPDKGYFTNNSTISTTISEFLIHNICGHSLHNLFDNKKEAIDRTQDTIITNNYYRIMAGQYFGGAAEQIGYDVGAKLMSKIIPECDKKTHYILCSNFTTKSEFNNLILKSELNKYPQQQLRSKVKQ